MPQKSRRSKLLQYQRKQDIEDNQEKFEDAGVRPSRVTAVVFPASILESAQTCIPIRHL